MGKIKKIWDNYYVKEFIIFLGIMFSFLIIDIYMRYFSNQFIRVYGYRHVSAFFFSISWVLLFILIFNLFNKKGRIISYSITLIIFNIIMLAQTLHMKILGRFFGLSDLFLASEGSDYFLYALKETSFLTVLVMLVSLICGIVTIIIMIKNEYRKKDIRDHIIISLTCILFSIFFRIDAINRLGKPCDSTTWEAAYNVRVIYDDFNNQSKNMEVAGLYEQTFKNSFMFIKESLTSNKKEMSKELNKKLSKTKNITVKNEYTGIYKNKNLILVLMESIDSYLVNDEVMPTLNKLKNEGWNFKNRYAPFFGGGQTINSEFAANTGLYSIDNNKAIYNFNNTYSKSVPSLFKDNGYKVNSIHMNSGKFYNRSMFHSYLGYENHYPLLDMKDIKKSNYGLDTNIMKNNELDKLIIPDEKFMSFIISYSAHLPYGKDNPNCTNQYGLDVKGNAELSCLRNLARDTDEFLKLLIEKLDKKNKLDDTVLVLFTDHYAYGYSDIDFVKKYKNVNNLDLIQNVPLVIWSKDIKKKTINNLVDTADIAPTILNLFGIDFDSRNYIGQDAFNKERDEFVYFSNGNFYDGKTYYDKNTKVIDKNKEYVSKMSSKVKYNLNINKDFILSDYFKYLDKNFK